MLSSCLATPLGGASPSRLPQGLPAGTGPPTGKVPDGELLVVPAVAAVTLRDTGLPSVCPCPPDHQRDSGGQRETLSLGAQTGSWESSSSPLVWTREDASSPPSPKSATICFLAEAGFQQAEIYLAWRRTQ